MPANDDEKLWSAYAKGVKPIAKVKLARLATKPVSPSKAKTTATRLAPRPVRDIARAESGSSLLDSPLDRNIERRLRKGDTPVEAKLDLHGMFQDEARMVLDEFIARQVKAGRRCLLIITGKGRGGEGVLRTNLEGWLANSPHAAQILALRPASPQHGGSGAFYVLLRKKD